MPGRDRIRSWTPLRLSLLVLALLAPQTLAACGDDETSTAPSSTPEGGLSVRVEPPTAPAGATVSASVQNDTGSQFTYGAAYALERETDDGYERVDLPQRPVIEIGYVARPGEAGPPVEVMLPGDLEPGSYRVIVAPDVPGGDLAGALEVIEGG